MTGRPYRDATVDSAPVAGGAAGTFTFSAAKDAHGVHGLFINNTTGQTIKIAYNGTVASATLYDEALANNGALHVTGDDRGVGVYDTISIFVPGGGTPANLIVRGA